MAWRYRFDEFELRPDEHRLLRAGIETPLTGRAFAVLQALVERGGQLLTRDELMARVWAGVVVEDNNLAVQVGALRRAIGPDAISTIAGVGYRFARPIARERLPDLEQEGAAARDLAPESPAGRRAPDAEPAATRRGNLPLRLPALVGRGRERALLENAIAGSPVVTICGGPGLGKTRLAQVVAQDVQSRFPDGVWWVDLVPIAPELANGSEPAAATGGTDEAVVAAVLAAMSMRAGEDDSVASLARRLKSSAVLLVLDNAEHVVGAVARFATALVGATAQAAVLVTSQRPLQSPLERLFRLEPLTLPGRDARIEEMREAEAVRLLAERARQADQPLPDTVAALHLATAICRALDGNALAIELAAARLPALGLEGLATRLEQRLRLLVPAPPVSPSRANALSVAIDWSHELLSPDEQRAFRRLGVLPGTFSFDFAVALLDELQGTTGPVPAHAASVAPLLALVERSLVSTERASAPLRPGAPTTDAAAEPAAQAPRHRLPESTRLYALDRLERAGELAAARRAMGVVLLRHLEAGETEVYSLPSRGAWRRRWGAEVDTVRVALDVLRDDEFALAVALYAACWPLWDALALPHEARRFGHDMAARVDATPALDDAVRARFWYALARANRGDFPQRCREAAARAAALFREQGDARGEFAALVELAFNWRVDHPQAREAIARAQAIDDPSWPPMLRQRLPNAASISHMVAGRFDDASRCFERCLALSREAGSEDGVTLALTNLADLYRMAGRLDEAIELGETLRERQRHCIGVEMSTPLCNLMGALTARGADRRAIEAGRECLRRMGPRAIDTCMWSNMDACAVLHARAGRVELAARVLGASDRAYREHGQDGRQPNEAEDRRIAAALVAERLDEASIARLMSEGEAWPIEEAIVRAYDPPESAATPGACGPDDLADAPMTQV